MNFYIAVILKLCIYWSFNQRIIIFIVPKKEFTCWSHAFDRLTLMIFFRLYKYEWRLSGQNNVIWGEPIRATAVVDSCKWPGIETVWKLTADGVLVLVLVISPENSSIFETCTAGNMLLMISKLAESRNHIQYTYKLAPCMIVINFSISNNHRQLQLSHKGSQ